MTNNFRLAIRKRWVIAAASHAINLTDLDIFHPPPLLPVCKAKQKPMTKEEAEAVFSPPGSFHNCSCGGCVRAGSPGMTSRLSDTLDKR